MQKYGLFSLHIRGLKWSSRDLQSSCRWEKDKQLLMCTDDRTRSNWFQHHQENFRLATLGDVINFVPGNLVQESVKPPPQEGLINRWGRNDLRRTTDPALEELKSCRLKHFCEIPSNIVYKYLILFSQIPWIKTALMAQNWFKVWGCSCLSQDFGLHCSLHFSPNLPAHAEGWKPKSKQGTSTGTRTLTGSQPLAVNITALTSFSPATI